MPWLKKGTWTILDQGLFAGSNFALNILLARWMLPEEYGAFTVAFSVFMLLGTLHSGLLTEPMLVFGPGRYRRWLPQYLSALLRGNAGFSVLSAVVLAAAGYGFYWYSAEEVATVLFALALAQPFILFLWLARRVCYVYHQPKWAALSGLLYAALVLAGAVVLERTAWLSAVTALGLMSGASLVAALVITLGYLRLPMLQPLPEKKTKAASVQHWRYGRWIVGTGLLGWVVGYLPVLVLPAVAGLEAGGALKALWNFTLPALHVYTALSALLLPTLVRVRGTDRFARIVRNLTALVTAIALFYWVVLGVLGRPMIDWLYAGQYVEYADLLWLVGGLLMAGIGVVMSAALKALERPQKVFRAFVFSALSVLTVGTACIYAFGLVGALLSLLIGMAVETALELYFFTRRGQEGTGSAIRSKAGARPRGSGRPKASATKRPPPGLPAPGARRADRSR
ncbi:MAG: lipopolysaccharide biosynthesis protein [Rhodothermales bacterium]